MVIGLTGPIASGKGLVTKMVLEFFAQKDLIHSVLLSDFIRDVVRKAGKPITRDALREAGNALRKTHGPGAWVDRMLATVSAQQEGILIVDSIRNPGEIARLREEFGDRVLVIATDAPMEERIARTLRRGREDDSTDSSEIERQMRIEMEDNPEFGFAIKRCQEAADVVSRAKDSKDERRTELFGWLSEFMRRMEGDEVREGLDERVAA